jgi:hypothetical protein
MSDIDNITYFLPNEIGYGPRTINLYNNLFTLEYRGFKRYSHEFELKIQCKLESIFFELELESFSIHSNYFMGIDDALIIYPVLLANKDKIKKLVENTHNLYKTIQRRKNIVT